MYIKGAVLLVWLGLALGDKGPDNKDSYENGVGTSFTVPLNPSVAKAVTKNSRKYSVSADDLERADLGVSASYKSSSVLGGAVVDTYSAPVNNLDSLAAAKVQPQDVAEARDGAGGHHHHHEAHHAEHPAPVGPQQQPSLQNEYTAPVSTGNLYYYYYPVAAYPLDEKVGQEAEDDELDPLVLVLIPAALLAGFLALVSIFNVSFNRSAARSFDTNESWRQNEVFGSWDQLQDKVDNLLENYYAALESESCMDRVVCELGTQANNISGKTLLITALDWFTPTAMRSRIDIFKEAANEGYAPHICKSKYFCDSQNLIQARRK